MTPTSSPASSVDSQAPLSAPVPGRSPALPARDALVVLALATLPLLAVAGGGFVADDFFFVTVLERTATPLFQYLTGAVLAMREVPTTFYRPLAMASLLAEIRAFGSDPWALHLSNLVLHAVAALAVWGIARRLVEGPHARVASIVAALAWAWFPRRVETVAWISCRPDLLATALATLGLWMWVEGARGHRTPLRAAGVLAWGLALLAKESVVALPLALVAWPALEGRVPAGDVLARFTRTAARSVALWPFVLMGAAYFALRRAATGAWIGGYGTSSLEFSVDTALKHFAYPAIPPLEFLNRLLTAPGVFLPVAVAVALLTLLVWVAIARALDTRAVAFGASWWVAAVLPVLPFLPSLTTTFNDRLMYLPGIGVALIAGGWWASGGRAVRVALAAFFAVTTVQTVAIAARWPVAGAMTARMVDGIAREARNVPETQPVLVAAVPDSYRGAYVLRNGLQYALQREGVANPARAAVLSYYLLETTSGSPVEVEAEDTSVLRVHGRDGRAEVMIGDQGLLFHVIAQDEATNDRYGRHRAVRFQLDDRALVLVAAPDGVTTLGVLGPSPFADPQVAPRVGPKE